MLEVQAFTALAIFFVCTDVHIQGLRRCHSAFRDERPGRQNIHSSLFFAKQTLGQLWMPYAISVSCHGV